MCEVHKVGRRTWLTRSVSGLVALWSALDFGFGREGWGVLVGGTPTPQGPGPRKLALAQEAHTHNIMRVEVDFPVPPGNAPGSLGATSAYVLVRGDEVAIVDTLIPGNADKIGEVIQTAGLGWGAVKHVVLTHWHPDHAGSVGAVTDVAQGAVVYAGEQDVPKINRPREIKAVRDGDEVFGLQIIATPGHTAGHVSVFDPASSAMILGDAVFNFGGNLAMGPAAFTENMDQAKSTLTKLGQLSFERGLVAHGPVLESGASAAIAKLAANLP